MRLSSASVSREMGRKWGEVEGKERSGENGEEVGRGGRDGEEWVEWGGSGERWERRGGVRRMGRGDVNWSKR